MGKTLYLTEKPSVAQEFAKALHEKFTRNDGYAFPFSYAKKRSVVLPD